MFCDETIIAVYLGKNEYDDIDGANCWFDVYHDIAFHTTEGYRLLLETNHFMISLGVSGVSITSKEDFKPIEHEWLEEYVHDFHGEAIVSFQSTLFVGQKIKAVEKHESHYLIQFDDFSMKLHIYDLGTMDKAHNRKNHWSYSSILGFDRFIKGNCPICGGEGELLLDFVGDYVVRCRSCKRSTRAEIQLRHAIDHWNNGEIHCDLSDITIE